MALYTPLTTQQISEVARTWGLPPLERFAAEPKGSVNTNYHLWAGGRRYFLRLNEGKTDADVEFESRVLRHLGDAGYPVAPLVVTPDGREHVALAGRQAMLFTFAPGEERARHDVGPEACRRVGEQLGRLHALAARFDRERPNAYGRERVAGWIGELEPDGRGDAEIADVLPLLRDELARAAALPAAPRGLVHGDLFIDNVLWLGDRISAILDWEMCCTDAFAYDLAVTSSAWCYGERAYEPALVGAFMAGYRAEASIAPETAGALWAYARYGALRYTASRIHAFHLAGLGTDRLAWKDWRRYRDRLVLLREMGEAGYRALFGV